MEKKKLKTENGQIDKNLKIEIDKRLLLVGTMGTIKVHKI